jgi:hypothetical protein
MAEGPSGPALWWWAGPFVSLRGLRVAWRGQLCPGAARIDTFQGLPFNALRGSGCGSSSRRGARAGCGVRCPGSGGRVARPSRWGAQFRAALAAVVRGEWPDCAGDNIDCGPQHCEHGDRGRAVEMISRGGRQHRHHVPPGQFLRGWLRCSSAPWALAGGWCESASRVVWRSETPQKLLHSLMCDMNLASTLPGVVQLCGVKYRVELLLPR